MSERKNIDRLFQEKFKDYEVAPPHDAWENIEARLNNREKKRRIIPFWLQFAGIAAVLVLGWFVFQNYYGGFDAQNSVVNQQKNSSSPNIQADDRLLNPIDSDNITNNGSDRNASADEKIVSSAPSEMNNSTGITSDKVVVKNSANSNSEIVISKSKTIQHLRMQKLAKNAQLKNSSEKNSTKTGIPNKGIAEVNSNDIGTSFPNVKNNVLNDNVLATPAGNEKSIAQNSNSGTSELNKSKIATDIESIVDKVDTTAIATVVPNSLEELLNEKENNVTTKEQKVNRWQISSNVAPIYFSSTSEGSPIDPQFSDKKKDYKQNLGYGVGVRYAINKKFTIRTGVNTIGMEYSTNDAVFYQTTNAKPLAHVNQNLQGSVLQIELKSSKPGMVEITPNSNIRQKFDATINQRTGYYEVPVELSYKLLDKKFAVELIGGMSTLFLNENNISVTSSGTTMDIGKANNLNNTHFSTNFGLGVKYNFLRSFQLNLEPIITYQFDTFTDSGNYQPFFFGIYSGINYRF